MDNILDQLSLYFSESFVIYALIVGVLVALCSSLLGVTLVLKRYSMIGDGLSHVAFGAMSVAMVVGLTNEMIIVMPITIIAAILLLKSSKKTKIKGDAAIAMISVGSLAGGYLILNVFSNSTNVSGDVCTTLFGSTAILTLNKTDVYLSIALSVLVIAVFVLFHNKIFAVTFDEGFARATGTNAQFYNLVIAVITAVVIVLAMNLVGALLISALIVFPSLSAMRLFTTFKSVIISAALISIFCAVSGIIISILASTPVGATIVLANIFVFAVFSGMRLVKRG